jgi:LVIVD repeat
MSKETKGPDSLEGNSGESRKKRGGVNRRTFLKNTAVAGAALRSLASATSGAALVAGAGLAGAETADAQATGLEPGGGVPPFRLPSGSLDFLDRKQYIHNMTIHSHISGASISAGEPQSNLWAKGSQRMLPIRGGFLDISNPLKPQVVNTNVWKGGLPGVTYNTRLKKWLLMSAAAQPLTGATPQYPHGQYDPALRKERVDYKGLRGIRVYDVTNPETPNLLQEFSTGTTGNGTHMNFYDGGRYAYLDCGWTDQLRMENAQRPYSNALMIVDMTDPSNIKEVSRWWVPGQMLDEEDEYKKYWFANDQASWTGIHGAPVVTKRVEDGGRYGYGGFGHFGLFVFDFADIRNPKVVGRTSWQFEPMSAIPYHSVYPIVTDPNHPELINYLFTTTETVQPDGREPYHTQYVVDVADRSNPRIVGLFPRPKAPKDAPYSDFTFARGRFGSHNGQAWIAPGMMQPNFVAMTFFCAGLRIFDISNPTEPRETAWFVPARSGELDKYETWFRGTSETVFVEWDRNLIWLGTHEGTYCMSTPALGAPVLEPRKIARWTVSHANLGWDG